MPPPARPGVPPGRIVPSPGRGDPMPGRCCMAGAGRIPALESEGRDILGVPPMLGRWKFGRCACMPPVLGLCICGRCCICGRACICGRCCICGRACICGRCIGAAGRAIGAAGRDIAGRPPPPAPPRPRCAPCPTTGAATSTITQAQASNRRISVTLSKKPSRFFETLSATLCESHYWPRHTRCRAPAAPLCPTITSPPAPPPVWPWASLLPPYPAGAASARSRVRSRAPRHRPRSDRCSARQSGLGP